MGARLWSVVIDAGDPVALGRFWAATLGWDHVVDGAGRSRSVAVGGDRTLHRLEFVTTTAPKPPVANWTHFDLSSTSLADQAATVERMVALGAAHLDIGQGADADHVVLADPEGNELCVLEPGNSFVDDGGRLGSLSCDGSPAAGYFWRDALGWPLVWDQDDETAIRPPDGDGALITFGGTPVERRTVRNRFRLTLAADDDDEVDRLLALGATTVAAVADDHDDAVALADPDGNEFSVRLPRLR